MRIMGSQTGVDDNINKGNTLGIETLPLSASLKAITENGLGIPCGVHFKDSEKEKTQNQIPAGGLVILSVTVTHPLCTQVFLCL